MALTGEQRQQYGEYYIQQAFQEMLGRDPTREEISYYFPAMGNDPNIHDTPNMRKQIAELAMKEKSLKEERERPERERKERESKLEAELPKRKGEVNDVFQTLLQRGATDKEINYFGKMLAAGDIDPYELDLFVQQMPEFREREAMAESEKRTAANARSREELNTELTRYDQEYFDKEKENVISRFAQANRINSPSLDFALTDLMGKIASERSRTMAAIGRDDYISERGYGREDYLGNKGLLREDYLTNLGRQFGDQDYGRVRQDQLEDIYRTRGFELSDYVTQRNDYMDAMARAKRKSNPGAGAAQGAMGGAAAGSAFGPWGAAIGGVGGGLFGYFNS